MLDEVVGDLFDTKWPAIGHGCNTIGAMGAGVAAGMHRRYPAMYQYYRRLCKLGQFKLGGFFSYRHEAEDRWIYNLGTQPTIGPTASLDAIRNSVRAMLADARFHRIPTVALPRIGTGLGGLTWAQVRPVLQEEASRQQGVRLVVVTLAEVHSDQPNGNGHRPAA